MQTRLRNKISQNLGGAQTSTSTWLSTVFIIGVALVLAINLGRVVINAKNNYEVYLAEYDGWVRLSDEKANLEDELEFYTSYEYKKLYARDFLHLAENGEKLYKVLGETNYYDLDTDISEWFPESGYIDWWKVLL